MNLIEVNEGSVTYYRRGKAIPALRNATLQIAAGERVGIIGGSGSGKTTLARLMLGLVRPSSGTVRWKGQELALALPQLRSNASLIYQDPNSSLNPRLRVAKIIAEPLHGKATKQQISEALSSVGLDSGLGNRFPHQLSGGQRQRVAIARGLIADPELLVADEPVSALDVLVRSQVLRVLRDEVAERNLALVMVSHDLTVVRQLCSRVLVLNRGEIVEDARIDEIFGNPKHPYTKELLSAALTL